jgi:hypothetical protein
MTAETEMTSAREPGQAPVLVNPDTAVQLVARALSERRAINPAAGLWVASEYAQALGYRVRPYTSAVASGPPQRVSPAPGTHGPAGNSG